MDEQKVLILDTRDDYKDITSRVETIERRGNLLDVHFKGLNKRFSYLYKNILFLDRPREITQDVAVNGALVLGAKQKILFDNFLKIFFKTKRSTELHHGDFKILDEPIIKTLSYFYCVAQRIKALPSDDGEEKNTLVADGIARINKIQMDTPLYSYLAGVLPAPAPSFGALIFPFACNASQLDAIEQAFSNCLSLIQGPPGTGKTQTILNILLSAVINKKRVAVVSNNNLAIQNIIEKLATKELDFLAALLGRRENVSAFLENQKDYPSWIREDSSTAIDENASIERVAALRLQLKALFAKQNELRQMQRELEDWEHECARFNLCYPDAVSIADEMHLQADVILQCFLRYESIARKGRELWIGHKWWNGVIRRWGSFAFWRQPLANVLVVLKKTFYFCKIKELKAKIQALETLLSRENFEALQHDLVQQSWCVLRAYLCETFGRSKDERQKFTRSSLDTEDFRREYPIVLSTTFMVERFTPEDKFDLLIIDEASQVDVCTGVLTLSCAKNVLVVGDDKQLPCVITDDDVKDLASLHDKFLIRDAYKYRPGQSLLSSIQAVLPSVASITLREHYRCAPLIIDFCNQKFYEGQLIIHTTSPKTSSLHVLFTAEGNHARGHFNLRQLQEVERLTGELCQKGYTQEQIGVCTPYRQQADKMKALTVHKFQGRECDVIILATVDNQISSFVSDERLMNVAISRAKKEFYLIIASSNQHWKNSIGDLINYIRYHTDSDETILKGKVVSVFDRLYTASQSYIADGSYDRFLFDSPAEKIIYDVLKKVLIEHDTERRYLFKMHIPLREIVNIGADLSAREAEYLYNRNTHLDFVIYERFGKTPCYAIEVDGYAYHKRGTKQATRDELKNSILKKRDFPLMRLSTIDSNEEERIRAFLFTQ